MMTKMRIRAPHFGQVRLTGPVPKIVSIFDMGVSDKIPTTGVMPRDPGAACDGNHGVGDLRSAVCDWLQAIDLVAAPSCPWRTYERLRTQAIWEKPIGFIGEPGWDRTIDLLIKSQLLYH
jgi:hypothetical protein